MVVKIIILNPLEGLYLKNEKKRLSTKSIEDNCSYDFQRWIKNKYFRF
jgi:hypothetical protein